MNKYLTVAATGLLAGAALMLAAAPAVAGVDINIGVPGVYVQPQAVYVQPRPVYIQPQYEADWRARQLRAIEWRDHQRNHGQEVSEAAHERNDARAHHRHNHHGHDRHDH
jgi:hypothetical protein